MPGVVAASSGGGGGFFGVVGRSPSAPISGKPAPTPSSPRRLLVTAPFPGRGVAAGGLGGGAFGLELSGAEVRSWRTFEERRWRLTRALSDSGGLVLIRGLAEMTPEELVEFSRAVGDDVERNPGISSKFLIAGWPEIQVIGERPRDP